MVEKKISHRWNEEMDFFSKKNPVGISNDFLVDTNI